MRSMTPALRTLLFFFLGGLLGVTESFCADDLLPPPRTLVRTGAEPSPLPSQQNANNAQLNGLRASFSSTRVAQQQISFAGASAQTKDQGVQHPEKLPPPNSVNLAAFSTPPMATQPSAAQSPAFDEESFDEESFGEKSLDEEQKFNAMLNKPLSSKKLTKNGDDAGKDKESKVGWSNKLVKPEFSPLFSIGGSFLIVVAAFFLLVILFRKVAPQGNRPLPKEAFECLGRHFLTQKQQLQVLRLGNRIVLVSVLPEGVTTLAEITDPDEVVAFLGHFRRLDTNSATEVFRNTIASMSEEELNRPYERPVVTSQRKTQPASSLDLYSDPDESLASLLARGRSNRR